MKTSPLTSPRCLAPGLAVLFIVTLSLAANPAARATDPPAPETQPKPGVQPDKPAQAPNEIDKLRQELAKAEAVIKKQRAELEDAIKANKALAQRVDKADKSLLESNVELAKAKERLEETTSELKNLRNEFTKLREGLLTEHAKSLEANRKAELNLQAAKESVAALERAAKLEAEARLLAKIPSGKDPSPTRLATVVVSVPSNAQVWFDNNLTLTTGTERSFETPPLTPGSSYEYQVKARWPQDGKIVVRTRTVSVRPGERTMVDFSDDVAPTSPKPMTQ